MDSFMMAVCLCMLHIWFIMDFSLKFMIFKRDLMQQLGMHQCNINILLPSIKYSQSASYALMCCKYIFVRKLDMFFLSHKTQRLLFKGWK